MTLTPQEFADLALASPEAISGGAHDLQEEMQESRWIRQNNRYRIATVKKAIADANGNRINSRHMIRYVAASAPLHCCDGWAFLGRAIGCHLHGDADSARHLSYYAELRATMSILASQGIAIFNGRHFVVDANGRARCFKKGGTHAVAWGILEAWAGLTSTADLFGNVLVPAGRPLSSWVTSLPNGAAWQPIASDWLLKLGLDLRLMAGDRNARNEASYRPTSLTSRPALSSVQAADAVREMWQLLEPAAPLSFGEIDRYLLRLTLEIAFKSTSGNLSTRNGRATIAFGNAVDATVAANIVGADTLLWREFLKRKVDSEDPTILERLRLKRPSTAPLDAERKIRKPDHHLSMMGRALLLLRLASGVNRSMLINAGIDLDDLAFWWQPYGMDRGLWSASPPASRITDAWADTQDCLDDMEEWIAQNGTASYHDLLSQMPQSVTNLTNLELVGIWSLAS